MAHVLAARAKPPHNRTSASGPPSGRSNSAHTLQKFALRGTLLAAAASSDNNDADFNPQPDIWESQALGLAVQIGFAAVCLAAVATLLALGQPIIDTTIAAFPDGEAPVGRDMTEELGINLGSSKY